MKCKRHGYGPPDHAGRVRGNDDGSAPHREKRDPLSGCGAGDPAFLDSRNRTEVPRLLWALVKSEDVERVPVHHLHQFIYGHTGQRGPLE